MGDMTIRGLDDAVLTELRLRAERVGISPESYAADLIAQAVQVSILDRLPTARRMLAAQTEVSPLSSVELLRQLRDEAQ
jgi:plasmid stability protein